MLDLNTAIANFVLTAQGRARNCRLEAARLKERLTGFELADRDSKVKIAKLEGDATVWDARAEVAKEGDVLVDVRDVHFQMQFTQLIGAAAAGSRARYIQPDAPTVYGEPQTTADPTSGAKPWTPNA